MVSSCGNFYLKFGVQNKLLLYDSWLIIYGRSEFWKFFASLRYQAFDFTQVTDIKKTQLNRKHLLIEYIVSEKQHVTFASSQSPGIYDKVTKGINYHFTC